MYEYVKSLCERERICVCERVKKSVCVKSVLVNECVKTMFYYLLDIKRVCAREKQIVCEKVYVCEGGSERGCGCGCVKLVFLLHTHRRIYNATSHCITCFRTVNGMQLLSFNLILRLTESPSMSDFAWVTRV
jgi:hypothetical protein